MVPFLLSQDPDNQGKLPAAYKRAQEGPLCCRRRLRKRREIGVELGVCGQLRQQSKERPDFIRWGPYHCIHQVDSYRVNWGTVLALLCHYLIFTASAFSSHRKLELNLTKKNTLGLWFVRMSSTTSWKHTRWVQIVSQTHWELLTPPMIAQGL